MKYLIFIFFAIFSCSTLAAQDTLYIRGERKPLLVEIKIIKKKTMNYRDVESGRVKTIKLKNVRKIRFDEDAQVEEKYTRPGREQEPLVFVEKTEFRSTILLQLSGILSQNQAGLNYMHRISPNVTEKTSFWIHAGGGYHAQRTVRRNTEGYYLEFGGRLELASRRNPEDRFHIGLDINNQWSEGTVSPDGSFIFGISGTEFVEDSRVAIQLPIGYTHRGANGVYFSTGLELSTHKYFPAFICRIGYNFGK